MKKLFQNKSLLKSIQIFLVCLVVFGGFNYYHSLSLSASAITISDFGFSEVYVPGGDNLPDSARGYACAWCGGEHNYNCPACYTRTVCDDNFIAGTHGCCPTCKVVDITCAHVVLIPACDSFTATPALIGLGASSALKWETTNATSVSIDNGVGNVALDNSVGKDVFPLVTTTYILTAVDNTGCSNTCEATVTICVPVCNNDNDCDRGNDCTVETCNNAGTCTASCSTASVGCVPGDGCCPGGCNNPPDTDCECKKGLVPCGRSCDVDSTTGYKENDPCTLCHLILMMQLIMDFLFKIAAVVAAFFIAASGFMYIFATGRPEMMSLAKTTFKLTLLGFGLIFIAWILVNTILTMFGYIDPLENNEWHIMC